jgi:hypothetical protein
MVNEKYVKRTNESLIKFVNRIIEWLIKKCIELKKGKWKICK